MSPHKHRSGRPSGAGWLALSRGLERTLSLGVLIGLAMSGCGWRAASEHGGETHAGRATAGGANAGGATAGESGPFSLEVMAEIRVEESPDAYRLPPERLRAGLELLLLQKKAQGLGVVALTSDRHGRIQARLEEGSYRVLSLSAPARAHEGQANQARPAIGMRTLEGQGTLLTDGLGLTKRGEELPETLKWEIRAGETLRPGNLTLTIRMRAWPVENGCVEHELLLPGLEGSVYLFSEPLYAQLCTQKP